MFLVQSLSLLKGNVFRFKNHWFEHPNFFAVVQQHWTAPAHIFDAAKILLAKFKNLRAALKAWKRTLSNLKNGYWQCEACTNLFAAH